MCGLILFLGCFFEIFVVVCVWYVSVEVECKIVEVGGVIEFVV